MNNFPLHILSRISVTLSKKRGIVLAIVLAALFLLPIVPSISHAATDPNFSNPNNTGFKLIICDGPPLPTGKGIYVPPNYTPCDFHGLMKQVQHLIDIMIIGGVLLSVVGFTYAGGLYMTGNPGNITKANDIFINIGKGLIIMLTAWFIVYIIISWLTGDNSAFTAIFKGSN